MERVIRLPILLAVLCILAYAIPQAADSSKSEQEEDTYAIYSLVLAHPETSHGPDDNERYLVAETTASVFSQEPCVQPPKEREAEFQEVMADYQQRKSIPRKLEPAFSIGKPYSLLDASAVRIMHLTQGQVSAIVVYVIEASHFRSPVLSGASLQRGRSSDERGAAMLLRPSSPSGASSTSCVAR